MSLSALARSPECEQLLKFSIDHDVADNWEFPPIDCFVNGRILSGNEAVGDTTNPELVVYINHKRSDDKCSIHLSTLIALATAHIKYQYEAVIAVLSSRGQPIKWELQNEPGSVDGRRVLQRPSRHPRGRVGGQEGGGRKHRDQRRHDRSGGQWPRRGTGSREGLWRDWLGSVTRLSRFWPNKNKF